MQPDQPMTETDLDLASRVRPPRTSDEVAWALSEAERLGLLEVPHG